MSEDIFKYWSFTSPPRDVQDMAFNWIEDQLNENKDKNYFFIEASVGSGKANMAITIGQYMNKIFKGNSCILTPQKILQKQYESIGTQDRINMVSFYGRKNYVCKNKGTDCDIGASFGKKCPDCPYDRARERAIASPLSVMNYDLFLSLKEYSEPFADVRYSSIICDEAHRLEAFLTEFNNLEWTKDKCYYYEVDYNPIKTKEQLVQYLKREAVPLLGEYLEFMENEYPFIMSEGGELDSSDSKTKEKYLMGVEDLIRMKRILGCSSDDFDFNYCIVTTENGWKVKHLFGATNFIKYIQPYHKKMVFLSGTFPDVQSTAIEMGLPLEECAFLALPTTFHKDIRPFVYMPVGKMNNSWSTNEVLKTNMVNNIKAILNEHSGDNGIIHTSSFAIAKWLIESLGDNNTHTIYNHNDGNRDRVIQEFTMNSHETKLLISPSITEGLDLKYDLGRFAIFVKIPFPYLGDEWVQKRTEISSEWYQKQAVISIVQGSGRVVRDKKDFGMTYMLDESYTLLQRNAGWMFPRYWNEAVMTIPPFVKK